MNKNVRHFGIQERSELLGVMRDFHAQCLKAKGQVGVYTELWDSLSDLLHKMDSTSEILTGDRQFLYNAQPYPIKARQRP